MKVLVYAPEEQTGVLVRLFAELTPETEIASSQNIAEILALTSRDIGDARVAFVDVSMKDAAEACRHFRQELSLSIVMLIEGAEANWEWIAEQGASVYVRLSAGKMLVLSHLKKVMLLQPVKGNVGT